MSAVESKKQYVVKCERQTDRIGLTFQFEHNGQVTWWQRRQDFEEEEDSGSGAMWARAAAKSYEQCAARLMGLAVPEDTVPNISMGDLDIEIDPEDGMALIEMSYYEYGARRATLEAHYSYKIPSRTLALAFTEAAMAIRKEVE